MTKQLVLVRKVQVTDNAFKCVFLVLLNMDRWATVFLLDAGLENLAVNI